MLGIKRILCPTDFSEYADRALAHAVAFAKWTGAEITALHAVPAVFPPPLAVPAPAPAIPFDAARRRKVEERLAAFTEPAREARVTVSPVLVEGEPVNEILARTQAGEADLVVMGTHGASGFERFVLGSVTEKVLRKAECPVVTVPRGERDTPSAFLFKTIVCAIDFSDCSAGALRAAADIARETTGRLVLLHVLDWLAPEDPRAVAHAPAPDRREWLEDDARTRLAAYGAGLDVLNERIVCGGRPYREILRVADEHDAGLLVMGVQGRGAIDLMLFGSTTHHVIREARCPVLTLRTPRAAAQMREPAGAVLAST
jgi:nucleotide-binding universal stress UspA family protein